MNLTGNVFVYVKDVRAQEYSPAVGHNQSHVFSLYFLKVVLHLTSEVDGYDLRAAIYRIGLQ